MGGMKRGWMLVGLLIAIVAGGLSAVAQLATTTVSDTVYRADGTPAGGSVVVSWGSFTTANGNAVTAGTTTVTIGTGGVFSIALAPNAGSTPMGTYYTAVFHLSDGTTKREYWSVPVVAAGGAPVTLAAISTQVLPASVAMQTVSKEYVDDAIAMAEAGNTPLDASPYVLKAGDTMTGPLNLPADPVSANQAADMHYVDASVDAITAGLGQKVSLVPSATQVVAQPSGTQLEANNLNGELYATGYLTGAGNNGIGNALTSPDCGSGCEVKVDATYPGPGPVYPTQLPPLTRVADARGGSLAQFSTDPLSPEDGAVSNGESINNVSVRSAVALAAQIPNQTLSSYALKLSNSALTGGSNQFPEGVESPPYFKSTYGVASLTGTYNTQGQHVQFGNVVNCYGVGDCLAGGQFIIDDGGLRDSADEGTHPFDLQVEEDNETFAGTCISGCTTGSTSLTVAATADGGTQGDGRFLIDKNPAGVINSGTLTGSGNSTALFSGTNFAVSVFVETAASATSQVKNMAPGTVTLPIVTSGALAGYATNTAALPASGVACVSDPGGLPNFEMANYSVVDGTHVRLTLNKVHAGGATMAVGGLCGYGVEETVDTVGPIRQLYPVIGSLTPTSLYYAQASSGVLGIKGLTGAYLNDSFTVASIARTGNVVTITATANFADDVNGLSMTVSGVADPSYNGTYVVSTTGPNTLTYANTGANSTSSGGTVSIVTGGFNLYPMAEVLSVYDPATRSVDGLLTLGPNTVAWANGDVVEEPHFYQQRVAADAEYITQYVPRPSIRQAAGKYYQGVVGPQLVGWEIGNSEPVTDYLGSGGTHHFPLTAYSVAGYWTNDFMVVPGSYSVIDVSCGARGCDRWDTGYALWSISTQTGTDVEHMAPNTDTVSWVLNGTTYSFSPTSFTAPTINVGTLNATTINGGVAASSITGTLNASLLPIFGPSGTSHAAGAVPDPGATAGATRFLREDGTWDVPASSGGTTGALAGGSAYTVPYQTAAGVTSMLSSPVTTGTYFLTEAPTASAAVAPVWTNAATYLASPPAIGGTAAAAGSFTSLSSTSSAVNGNLNMTYNGTASTNMGLAQCPSISPGGYCAWTFGYNSSAGNFIQMGFNHNTNSQGYLFTGVVPMNLISSAYTGTSNSLSVSNSSSSSSVGFSCASGVALCVAPSSNTAAPFMVSAAGATTTAQVIGGGSAPTMVAGAAAGSSPACTGITGANMAGVITCTTGSATVASTTLATITFNGTLGTAPQGCKVMPRNAATAAAVTTVYTTAPSTTAWTIAIGGTALSASTAYSWSYDCL